MYKAKYERDRIQSERDEWMAIEADYRLAPLTTLFANVHNDRKQNPIGYKYEDFFPRVARLLNAGESNSEEDEEAARIKAATKIFNVAKMWSRELGKVEPTSVNGN